MEYLDNGQREIQPFPLENLGNNETFIHLLQSNPIETIHTQETTLEEIFMDVTGKSLL